MQLKDDYGTENLCAYTSAESAAKEAFLKDGRKFLNALAKELDWEGYDGKRGVWVNKGGIAVSGEAMASLFPRGEDRGVFVQIGVTGPIPGIIASSSGITIMYRATRRDDPYGGETNRWASWNTSVMELADAIRAL